MSLSEAHIVTHRICSMVSIFEKFLSYTTRAVLEELSGTIVVDYQSLQSNPDGKS